MTHPLAAARAPLAALALVGALALAGCGDDTDEPGDAASPSGSVSAGASDDASASGEPSDTAGTSSEEPSPSASAPAVAPATGPVMQLDDMSANAPQGWEISIDKDTQQAAFNASGGPGVMTLSLLGAVPGESFDTTLEGTLETMKSDGLKPQRLDDLTLDGVQTWVLSGSKRGVPLEVQMGGLAGSDTFRISFQYLTEPPADVQTTIDGVLATVVFDAA